MIKRLNRISYFHVCFYFRYDCVHPWWRNTAAQPASLSWIWLVPIMIAWNRRSYLIISYFPPYSFSSKFCGLLACRKLFFFFFISPRFFLFYRFVWNAVIDKKKQWIMFFLSLSSYSFGCASQNIKSNQSPSTFDWSQAAPRTKAASSEFGGNLAFDQRQNLLAGFSFSFFHQMKPNYNWIMIFLLVRVSFFSSSYPDCLILGQNMWRRQVWSQSWWHFRP